MNTTHKRNINNKESHVEPTPTLAQVFDELNHTVLVLRCVSSSKNIAKEEENTTTTTISTTRSSSTSLAGLSSLALREDCLRK